MVLHRDHRGVRIERAVGVAQPQNVGELQRRGAGKQNFTRGAEFDDGAFLDARAARLAAVTRAVAARELNRNANRRGLGKKARQVGDCAGVAPYAMELWLVAPSDDDPFLKPRKNLSFRTGPDGPVRNLLFLVG